MNMTETIKTKSRRILTMFNKQNQIKIKISLTSVVDGDSFINCLLSGGGGITWKQKYIVFKQFRSDKK